MRMRIWRVCISKSWFPWAKKYVWGTFEILFSHLLITYSLVFLFRFLFGIRILYFKWATRNYKIINISWGYSALFARHIINAFIGTRTNLLLEGFSTALASSSACFRASNSCFLSISCLSLSTAFCFSFSIFSKPSLIHAGNCLRFAASIVKISPSFYHGTAHNVITSVISWQHMKIY